jgi:molybdopterin-binding protein
VVRAIRPNSLLDVKNTKRFTPREVCPGAGISYRETVDLQGQDPHHKDGRRPFIVFPRKEVDKFLCRDSRRRPVRERRTNFSRISGHNQLVGRAGEIKISGLMAQVSLSIGGQQRTSIVTSDAVREVRLKIGETAAALIKSTEVMIVRP